MLKSVAVAAVSMAFVLFAAFAGAKGVLPRDNSKAAALMPAAATPTAEELLGLDKQATEAYLHGDGQFFEGLLSDKIVMSNDGHRMSKADVIKMISGVKCNVKNYSLSEPHRERVDDDTYILIYKATLDGTCTSNGKTDHPPSPVRAATVWIRSSEKWQADFHGENPIVDSKTLSESYKKDESEKGGLAKDTAAAPGPANRIDDAGAEGLMAAEQTIWGAWKGKDAKKLEDLTTADMTFVNIFGTYFANKADAIKDWTGPTCHVTSFSLTDGVGTLISPTVGILTVTGSVNGDCGGQKPPPVYGASVYLKDGGAWKWVFGFNSPH